MIRRPPLKDNVLGASKHSKVLTYIIGEIEGGGAHCGKLDRPTSTLSGRQVSMLGAPVRSWRPDARRGAETKLTTGKPGWRVFVDPFVLVVGD